MALSATSASAHEFWIEAKDYTLAPDAPLVADIRVGMRFKGNGLGFNPNRHTRFDVVTDGGAEPIASRLGDRPAIDQAIAGGGGLAIVVHQASDLNLDYDDPAKFEQFVREEGLDGTLEAHAARGLPPAGFREIYSRHAKALIDTGPGGGDRALGLPVEIVVEDDPYADPMPEAVTVRALAGGEPMSGALLNVFSRAEGEAREDTAHMPIRLDADGRAEVALEPGHRYLANAVLMREPDAAKARETGAAWESLWASSTWSTERD